MHRNALQRQHFRDATLLRWFYIQLNVYSQARTTAHWPFAPQEPGRVLPARIPLTWFKRHYTSLFPGKMDTAARCAVNLLRKSDEWSFDEPSDLSHIADWRPVVRDAVHKLEFQLRGVTRQQTTAKWENMSLHRRQGSIAAARLLPLLLKRLPCRSSPACLPRVSTVIGFSTSYSWRFLLRARLNVALSAFITYCGPGWREPCRGMVGPA